MRTPFDQLQDLAMLERIMQVNYFGAVYVTHYALPYLKETRGRLVAVSSLAGKNGVPTRSGYAASKHALAGFFNTLRIELLGTGVSVTIIYPGFVTSEIRERLTGMRRSSELLTKQKALSPSRLNPETWLRLTR